MAKQPSPLTNILTDIGLSPEQTKVYLTLLEHGPQSASDLAKLTRFQRTNIYHLCRLLSTLQLITSTRVGRTTIFSPSSPDHLTTQAAKRQLEAEQATRSLEDLLPNLKDMYASQETRPTITHYSGKEGLKEIFREIYAPKNEPLLGCVDLDKMEKAIPKFLEGEHVPNRIKNKVEAIAFFSDSPLARKLHATDKQDLRKSTLVDKKKYPFPAEIDVYEDKIAMLSFDHGNFVGLLIQNQAIATTLKSILKIAFDK